MNPLCRVVALLAVASAVPFVPAAARAAQSITYPEGKPLPVVSATAAAGKWLERAPFDAATYGRTRGVSPAVSPEPKIVLHTFALSDDFFKIAAAVDRYVADHSELAWSYVLVTDTKGAQAGGYSAEETRRRLDEIRALAESHGVTHLSFLLSAPGSNTQTPNPTIILAHVRPANKPETAPIVDFSAELPADALQGNRLANYLSSLDATIGIKPESTAPAFSVVRLKPGETRTLEFTLFGHDFRPEGKSGRDFLSVRRANLTVGGQATNLGHNFPPFTDAPGLDVVWEKESPALSFHARPDASPGTHDLIFLYQPFGGSGSVAIGVRVVIGG